jgi:hypothetical protein
MGWVPPEGTGTGRGAGDSDEGDCERGETFRRRR